MGVVMAWSWERKGDNQGEVRTQATAPGIMSLTPKLNAAHSSAVPPPHHPWGRDPFTSLMRKASRVSGPFPALRFHNWDQEAVPVSPFFQEAATVVTMTFCPHDFLPSSAPSCYPPGSLPKPLISYFLSPVTSNNRTVLCNGNSGGMIMGLLTRSLVNQLINEPMQLTWRWLPWAWGDAGP